MSEMDSRNSIFVWRGARRTHSRDGSVLKCTDRARSANAMHLIGTFRQYQMHRRPDIHRLHKRPKASQEVDLEAQ